MQLELLLKKVLLLVVVVHFFMLLKNLIKLKQKVMTKKQELI